MKCLLCWGMNCQCPCRGWGCKGCWQSNNQVTYTNELLKLWMDPKLIFDNLDFIHKAQSSRIQAYDVWDKLVNGKELSEEKLEAIEKGITIKWEPIKREVKDDTITPRGDNPTQEHSFPSKTNPWVRCEFCGWIAHYVKWKPCPAFKWDNKE